MVDSVQMVLLIVIITLTILLVILGIQVFFILRDLRRTIIKTNKVLDTADAITENIQGPLSTISSLALGIPASSIMTVLKLVKNFIGKDKQTQQRHHE